MKSCFPEKKIRKWREFILKTNINWPFADRRIRPVLKLNLPFLSDKNTRTERRLTLVDLKNFVKWCAITIDCDMSYGTWCTIKSKTSGIFFWLFQVISVQCPVSHREYHSSPLCVLTDRFVLSGDVTPLSASISPAWTHPDWRRGLVLWTCVYLSAIFMLTIWQSLQPVYFLRYKLLNACRQHHSKNQDVLVHFTIHTQFNFFCQQEGDGCYGNDTMGMPCLSIVSVPCHTHTRAQTLTQQEPQTVKLNKKP